MAGGAARRFGGVPKGLCRVHGRRIAGRVLGALGDACEARVVVANDARASRWFPGLPTVADREAGLGPLAGLATALRAASGTAALVVAWDMPFVTAELLRALRHRGEMAGRTTVPVHGPAHVREPLCAYYRPDALEALEALLAGGERRAHVLYEVLAARHAAIAMPDAELLAFGDPSGLFTSVDTPHALAALHGELPDPRELV
jgi:molybdopterin-guanine dinucleotide biosynthesis protein A